MKYHVVLGGQEHPVEVERSGAQLRVRLGGHEHRVDVGALREGHAYSLLIDGRSIDVGVEEHGPRLDLLIAGRRYATEVLGEREWLARGIQGEAGDGDALVRAVMTGIVREVLVAPGDAVAAGQTLFILEAMKMENEVKAGRAGTVARVSAQAGQTVSIGDVVVEIG